MDDALDFGADLVEAKRSVRASNPVLKRMDKRDPLIRFGPTGTETRRAITALSVCRIGRDAGNDVVLSDAGISRTHAMIRRDISGICFLSDVGSRNGTQLNGLPISAPVALSHGDLIKIGGELLTFEQEAPPVPVVEPNRGGETQAYMTTSFVTVLVIDIRGYTALAREIGEEKISKLLSTFFGGVADLLRRRRAWYHKYIGDCFMALWVHDRREVDHAVFAAVLDVILATQELVAPLQSRFGLSGPVRFGVGMNSGLAAIGNLGSIGAADFTAVGDTVNKAFRLESATRTCGHSVLIGRESIDMLRPAVAVPASIECLALALKGYDSPQEAYSLDFGDIAALAGEMMVAAHANSARP
ncbi:FHA domain-containing protein [Sphingomonas sp. MAH-20]|uniref:FHA domain-containing protein n=1 Tax=Sphingomonas horti TaxID=2682842 RepID=A0A6I4IX63_9SPHN|nr:MULTISPECIES: adenylate/guanylate cyclase domain-containing protein [Sphingomonas]MBA2920528.1 FHA domain-containing protein [Sphingomonas sp. CGMCC 1.13658]MVO76780.1 FHA domain-containing protein [Sphingomonas horti]